MKIVALAPNWLGDAVMCTPALRALRKRYPDAALSVACKPTIAAIFDGLSWIDELVEIGPRGMFRDAARIRPHARDLAAVFPHSFRAALLARMAGARRRVGYDRDHRGWLLTDRVAPYRENGRITPVYMAREYLDLVAPLGCVDDGLGLELHADPVLVEGVKKQLDPSRPVVGIAPGSASWTSKRWLPERFAAVADALVERVGGQCVLLTGPGEEDTRDAVVRAAKHPLLDVYRGQSSVAKLKAAVSQLDLLIGNDSGPRHIAVAFRVPVICIMGSTSPRYSNGPYEVGRVLRVDVDCGPCQRPTCMTDFRCMTEISTEEAVQAALDVLRGANTP